MPHVLHMVITLVENHGKVGNFSADHSKNFLQKIYLIKKIIFEPAVKYKNVDKWVYG